MKQPQLNKIVLPRFPTHIERTNNKIKQNTFFKINNQAIYNGSLTKFSRGIVISNMHNWILSEFGKHTIEHIDCPVKLYLRIYTVKNHNMIRRLRGAVRWKPPEPNYVVNWDEDNLRAIWEKCIKDCLSKAGAWPDDTAYYCRGVDSEICFVNELDERSIELWMEKVVR